MEVEGSALVARETGTEDAATVAEQVETVAALAAWAEEKAVAAQMVAG